ncbi:unnamed protein product [Eruca vesicaria subsp. sativa]|uniref:Uncharacterized protein n=1 Tax=Eruca vesicaria subsp. sativa TaxID=29727 RepID=A0ABC8LT91_ERUVS|nr:unnamed protein product [Eruca vesicaria subsp. sativa]
MFISKKTIVLSLALVAVMCIVMSTTEATTISNGAMKGDEKGCTAGNCKEGEANPYKRGCEPGLRCRGGI